MAIANPGQQAERSVTHDARILVVDDEPDIADLLGTVLREEGFTVRVVTDSRQALEVFNSFRPDLVSLDVMMPSVDGISICLQLRRETDVPVLFVSAKSDPPDRVVGLRIGADDYMGKPFDNNELVARVEALLRRRSYAAVADRDRRQLRFGLFIIDLGSVQAIRGDTALPLTPTEFKLLKALGGEPGRVFTRDDLLIGVWGYTPGSDTRLVDVHVGRLRKKLLDAGVSEVAIETARGFGYKLTVTQPGQPPES
ncbi:MAG TPA: response regulator transcription factor [Candidatus Limnocylindria bacterium]|nr:response regulator transcription factor [Candidatus Limnocylindria bacterium]